MQAIAVYPKSKEVRLIDIPEPKIISPTDVLVRILEAVSYTHLTLPTIYSV